jgi:cell division septum initiation protein DivIVA
MLKYPWLKQILRDAEGEGGGGGGSLDGGASDGTPAPADDRTSKIEGRLDRLAQSVEGFISGQKKSQAETEVAQNEQRIKYAEQKAATAVDEAEAALATAFDDGDGVKIAKAQRVLAEAASKSERVNAAAYEARARAKDAEKRKGGTRSDDDALDTSNLDGWKKKHKSWYGIDQAMTQAAHELDAQIRENNVLVQGSKEYYDAIDRQMSKKFPDQFGGSPATGGNGGTGIGGGAGSQKRIPAPVAAGLRRMGIDIDDPDVAKRMIANREKAVRKGWLPEIPVTGSVVTR